MPHEHSYTVAVEWSGSTEQLEAYSRNHTVRSDAETLLAGSSDPAFRGDPTRWNPEQLLVSALAQCHMLWFLALAAHAGVVVTGYIDQAIGRMTEHPDGAGEFTEVVLRPEVTVRGDVAPGTLDRLHHRAHEKCFIARSVNFPVRCEPAAVTSAAR